MNQVTKRVISLQEIKKNSKVVKVEHLDRFTFAQCSYDKPLSKEESNGSTTKKYTGTGWARQGEGDRPNDDVGKNIAVSNAQKALFRRVNRRPINSSRMG